MDFSKGSGAEFREIHDRMREGENVRVAVASKSYTTDRDDLWNALTDPERIPRWFLPVSGDLELGGRYPVREPPVWDGIYRSSV